jgi:FKBP-type peptidyl-prolyl cis-trans isomerase
MTTQSKELSIEDTFVGTGAEVKSGDIVTIHYAGRLEDGKQFDSSYDRGEPFSTKIGVGMVIAGWDQGIVGMKVGGKRVLTIPGYMAYGDRGIPGVIPPNATLIFETELLDVR